MVGTLTNINNINNNNNNNNYSGRPSNARVPRRPSYTRVPRRPSNTRVPRTNSAAQQRRERRVERSRVFTNLQTLKSNRNNLVNQQTDIKRIFKNQRNNLFSREKNALSPLKTQLTALNRTIKQKRLLYNQTKVKVPGKVSAFMRRLRMPR